ncbi:MAG TPA: S-adenosylmethionine decarboxylase [Pyrinomonadaceae bacterium]
MIVGTEWLVDASGCRAETLCDVEALRRLFERIIGDLNLQVVGEQMWHSFPAPGGVTGLALLTESHLACHTYPEFQTATINLYCCRERPAWPWAERLRELLGATGVRVRVHHRVIDEKQAIETESALNSESSAQAKLSKSSLAGGGR